MHETPKGTHTLRYMHHSLSRKTLRPLKFVLQYLSKYYHRTRSSILAKPKNMHMANLIKTTLTFDDGSVQEFDAAPAAVPATPTEIDLTNGQTLTIKAV